MRGRTRIVQFNSFAELNFSQAEFLIAFVNLLISRSPLPP